MGKWKNSREEPCKHFFFGTSRVASKFNPKNFHPFPLSQKILSFSFHSYFFFNTGGRHIGFQHGSPLKIIGSHFRLWFPFWFSSSLNDASVLESKKGLIGLVQDFLQWKLSITSFSFQLTFFIAHFITYIYLKIKDLERRILLFRISKLKSKSDF